MSPLRTLWRRFWAPEAPPAFPREATWVTLVTTGLMLLDGYDALGLAREEPESFVLYFVILLLALFLLARRPPRDYGLTLGRWRAGLALTALTWVVGAGLILYSVRHDPTMPAYYRPLWSPAYPGWVLLDMVGWEFLFRGALLFAYARAFGPGPALMLQMVPFALLHIGKPALETYSTLLGGLWFGIMAWRSRSVVYPILGHWFIGWFVAWAAVHLGGG